MPPEPGRAVSDRSDRTPPEEGLSSHSALRSQQPDSAPDAAAPMDDATAPAEAHVEPHSATRTQVRVGPDGAATIGRKKRQFGRSLAGALVTVEVP